MIVDNVERIIDYIDMGPRFSNHVLQALLVIVNKIPPKGNKLLVIGTTSSERELKELNVVEAFNISINVPVLNKTNPDEIEKVLKVSAGIKVDDIKKIISSMPEKIAMKQLLLVCEMARSNVNEGELIGESAFKKALFDCGLNALK